MIPDHGIIGDSFAAAPARPTWLITLADLALLLLGFLVLVQATANSEAVARSLRSRFGASTAVPLPVPPPLPIADTAVLFATDSAALTQTAPLIEWTGEALRDPRVTVTVTGSVAPSERGGTLLAADRARAVVATLVAAGLPADRLAIATTRSAGSRATLTFAFAGELGNRP